MMCACDESFGQRFLAHQLSEACELDTQERVPVTYGFEPGFCNGCRELPLALAPCVSPKTLEPGSARDAAKQLTNRYPNQRIILLSGSLCVWIMRNNK
jgi:hypothetical protein